MADSSRFEQFAGSLRTIASEVHHLSATTSTMDVAWELARNGAADGTVVLADQQTAGRGRYDRTWVSQPGQDVLCSVVLRPQIAAAGELLMLAALGVVDVAESSGCGIEAGIKWPNDVQVGGKKLAGVIAESVSGPTSSVSASNSGEVDHDVDYVEAVIGIGLNVNFHPAEHRDAAPGSTSLSVELGKPVDRYVIFIKLMQALDSMYTEITSGGSVLPVWRKKLTTLGREVTVVSGEPGNSTTLHGLAYDVDSIGRLIVRDANGKDWPVSAGEVTVQNIT